ncbi:nucleoside-diphosphate sugar epimerase/dehydratase [Marinomonas transparens]|uniref:Uncharacterized protein n=1 Tax=Marinomonas transparens TaxID=2795388 RepID=A0A934MWQ7_9GAMM|nr:hypothetical protein [Marinomonas transparens]MBJ7538434.1 hypothetical protein [Marinomonas transparens]
MALTLQQRLCRFFKANTPPKKVVFIGIDYQCFTLSKSLLDNNLTSSQPIEITAFINDEPWANRTQVHGVTVYSPSEVSALINKYGVDLLVQIQGESITIADNIWEGILKTQVRVITLEQGQDLATQQQIIYDAMTKQTPS